MRTRPTPLALAVMFALWATIARAVEPAPQPTTQPATDFRRLGLAALAFTEAHYRAANGLFVDAYTPGGKPVKTAAAAWGAGVQLSALNAAARLDPRLDPKRIAAAHAYAVKLDAYRFTPKGEPVGYQPFPGNTPDELFYDDNCWLALAFLDTYRLTHDAKDLRRARDAFAYVASGESPDLGGGIWWSSKRKEKNTCSNAPAICAALELYLETKDANALALAERVYTWVGKLQDPADGLFWDNEKPPEQIEKTKWSYNTGLMIRANVLFYRIKGDGKYLADATRLADAAEAKWFRESDGALTDDGAFGHLLCEALLTLDAVSPRPATVARVQRALDHLATLAHGGGYPKRWDDWRPKEAGVGLLQQASAARGFLMLEGHPKSTTRQ